MGAHAEYIVVSESVPIERMPEAINPVRATALVGTTAMSFLRETADLRPGNAKRDFMDTVDRDDGAVALEKLWEAACATPAERDRVKMLGDEFGDDLLSPTTGHEFAI